MSGTLCCRVPLRLESALEDAPWLVLDFVLAPTSGLAFVLSVRPPLRIHVASVHIFTLPGNHGHLSVLLGAPLWAFAYFSC